MIKHSLHIGINHVSVTAYNGWPGELSGCVNDAITMKALIKPDGFCQMLFNENATFDNIVKAFTTLAKIVKPEDKTFITFSCHGTQIPDINKDEKDKLDEALCLYDGLLVDDQLGKLIKLLNCNVYVISDSCHSGTISKAAAFFGSIGKTKAMPKWVMEIDIPMHEVKEAGTFKPNVLTFAACQDNEVSYDLGTNGAFTKALYDVFTTHLNITYSDLVLKIKRILKGSQTPKLSYLTEKKIVKEKAFK